MRLDIRKDVRAFLQRINKRVGIVVANQSVIAGAAAECSLCRARAEHDF